MELRMIHNKGYSLRRGRDLEKVDAPDIVYLSSFDEFPEEMQESLKYLKWKILVKSGVCF